MTSKIRRAIVAGTLAASTLVVGGIGAVNAWAQSSSADTPSASQSQATGSTGSTGSIDSRSSTDDCPNHDASAGDSSSADASA
jgi:hypothetical protein